MEFFGKVFFLADFAKGVVDADHADGSRALGHDDFGHRAAETALQGVVFARDERAGFLDRVDDCFFVDGFPGVDIQNACVDAFFFQTFQEAFTAVLKYDDNK